MSTLRPQGVPMIPNAALVHGKLLLIKSAQNNPGSIFEVQVDKSDDVSNLANFAKSYIGKSIQVFVHPQLIHNLSIGDDVELQVSYRGDERDGQFSLINDHAKKI